MASPALDSAHCGVCFATVATKCGSVCVFFLLTDNQAPAGGRGEGGGGQIVVKVFKVFSHYRVVCFVEQIVEDVGKVEVFKVSSQAWVLQRFVVGLVTPFSHVNEPLTKLTLEILRHYFYEPVAVSVYPRVMRQSTKAFGRISCGFLRDGAP